MNCEALQTFGQEVHKLLTKAKDATFELMDAVMTTRQASSLAEFSLSPMFRRQYPSIAVAKAVDTYLNLSPRRQAFAASGNNRTLQHLAAISIAVLSESPWRLLYI